MTDQNRAYPSLKEDKDILSAITDLEHHEGWRQLTMKLAEHRTEYLLSLPYAINDERELYHLKGWVDCLDSIIEAVIEAKAEQHIEEFSDE